MKRDYKELIVWQKAIDLVVEIYKATKAFPKEELYGLTSQLRRCAVSVPRNIAEGQGRLTRGEFRQFLPTRQRIVGGDGDPVDNCRKARLP